MASPRLLRVLPKAERLCDLVFAIKLRDPKQGEGPELRVQSESAEGRTVVWAEFQPCHKTEAKTDPPELAGHRSLAPQSRDFPCAGRLAFLSSGLRLQEVGRRPRCEVEFDFWGDGSRQAGACVPPSCPPPGAAVTKVEGAPPSPGWPGEGAAHTRVWRAGVPCVPRDLFLGVKSPGESSQAPLELTCKCSLRFLPTLRAGLSPTSCTGFCFPENLASRSPGVHSVPTGQERPH